MRIDTKFSCGDKVFTIGITTPQEAVTCPFCAGTGKIECVNKEKIQCTKCYGRPQYKTLPKIHSVHEGVKTIGQVRYEYTESKGLAGETVFYNYKPQSKTEEKYMLVETGVGSGSLWGLDRLFATKEEAEEACKELNK